MTHSKMVTPALFCVFLLTSGMLNAQDDDEETLPLHIDSSLSNSIGIGTFLPAYERMPSFSTGIVLAPSYKIPKFFSLPRLSLSAKLSFDASWLSAYNASRQFNLSDLDIRLSMPKAFQFDNIGLFLGTSIRMMAPLSKMSRAQGRVLGFGASAIVGWEKYGFRATYTPSISGWAFSSSEQTLPCGGSGRTALPSVVNPNNADFGVEQYMWDLAVSRSEERLPSGRCIISGRQIVSTLNQTAEIEWSYGNHTIGANLVWSIAFLRGLENRPELHSPYASTQNFTESSQAKVGYTYTVPIDLLDLDIEGGVLSYQAAYNAKGKIRFPFFDFFTAQNNFTQVFVDISVAI